MIHHKPTPTSDNQTEAKADVIKLGIDVHKSEYVVVQQIDEQAPKAPQKFTPDAFVKYIVKLKSSSARLVSCYEAGCFGYVLHRRLEAMGIENLVVRPRNWDEYGNRVKTDARDAKELSSHLDRYLAGNTSALAVVRVPTETEERSRSLSRQRDVLAKEVKRLQSVGVGNARYYGIELSQSWWKPRTFKALKEELAEFLLELLQPLQSVLVGINEQLKAMTEREELKSKRIIPIGLGALSASILDEEFCDYTRFKNRKQVASFTGLCPAESSSGGSRRQGSINKHGNPRIRRTLVEAVWRLLHYQPDYAVIQHWKKRMCNEPFGRAKKKKMIIAIARRFAVDWWRINTGQITAEQLGLKTSYPASLLKRLPAEAFEMS
ncbi:MAG: IS110 family transposase [Coraliomargarita sp.]